MNLLETILNAQNGDVLRQLANTFQLDEGTTRSAVGELVPAVARGVRNNTANPQGLEALLGALTRGQHDRYLDEPARLAADETVADGNGILGHIFGSKDVSRQVAGRAAERSGVDAGTLKKMLPVIASLAMGAMSKQGLGGGAAAAPGGIPGASAGGGIGGMLTSFLDADKDGSMVDDLLGMAGKLFR